MALESSSAPYCFVFGSSHLQAPLEVRERLAIGRTKAEALCRDLLGQGNWQEYLLLNTCNRVEIYGVANGNVAALSQRQILDALSRLHGIDPQVILEHSFWLTDEDAIAHAFQVASGLQSQILGETEILGQMKDAYEKAAQARTAGSVLNRVFQKSFQAAKWVRTHTGISRGNVSIGNVAAELSARVCGGLAQSSVLLLGTGEVGERTAQALVGRGARGVTVVGRQQDKAQAMAAALGGSAVQFAALPQLLPNADVVIGATSAPRPLLRAKLIEQAMRQRPLRPMFLIDTAMPRDVEPQAQAIPNIHLYNLDDLSAIANENLKARQAEKIHAREQITRRANALHRHFAASTADTEGAHLAASPQPASSTHRVENVAPAAQVCPAPLPS